MGINSEYGASAEKIRAERKRLAERTPEEVARDNKEDRKLFIIAGIFGVVLIVLGVIGTFLGW